MEPRLEFVFESRLKLAPRLRLDNPPSGGARLSVPVLEGEFEGPRLRGTRAQSRRRVCACARDGVFSFDARYFMQEQDGTLIYLQNRGYRHGPPDVMDRLYKLAPGDVVDPSLYYFRCTPTFEDAARPARLADQICFHRGRLPRRKGQQNPLLSGAVDNIPLRGIRSDRGRRHGIFATCAAACLLAWSAFCCRSEFSGQRRGAELSGQADQGHHRFCARHAAGPCDAPPDRSGWRRCSGSRLLIESKAGAGGVIGTDFVAKAPPDGYTLTAGTLGTHAFNPISTSRCPTTR